MFVVGFLVAVLLGSTNVLPDDVLFAAEALSTALLAAALFGLGTSVRVAPLARTGGRALVVGTAAWAGVCTMAYMGVALVTP